MKSKKIICISCPRGCLLNLKIKGRKILKISGNFCKKGRDYAEKEISSPSRILTTTVKVKNGIYPVLPVRSNRAIPFSKIFQAMKILNKIVVCAPVKRGEVIVENILNTGVDIISSRDLKKGEN
jgi:CxxC motif-containing protein